MLILDAIRTEGEYRGLVGDLATAFGGRSLPYAVCGLCDGAADALLAALLADLQKPKNGAALLLLSEEKECVRMQHFFTAMGLRAAFYTARDLTF